MKGEYVPPNKTQSRHQQQQQQQNNMFSKLHPFANQFQQQQQPQLGSATTSDDSAAPHAPAAPPPPSDGATIEVVRRPRGRPPGSKNKPKPPVIITRDADPPMSPYILEVPPGADVVDAIARFCRRKGIGLCVLAGSGAVSNVTLRQPSSTPGATVTFHGRFDILSVTATFLPPNPPPCPPLPAAFTVSLAAPQGQIVGGLVSGALLAASTVYVVAASFNNPSFHRLPPPDDDRHDAAPSPDHDMPLYACHVAPSDVVWAPTPRQPPPPPPPGY